MARSKDTFILRDDFYPQIKMLTMEQRGILFTAIYAYELGEELPEMDPLTAMCFGFIKSSLDANAEKYESRCEINRENGGKGGRPRNNRTVLEETPKNRMVPEKTERLSEKPNGLQNNRTVLEENDENPIDIDSDSDSEFDSDSVSVSESDSRGTAEREKERFFEIFFFMNFQNPSEEVDRFVNHYSANGWCRANSTTPVKDRFALARSWSQADKAAPPRFPREFLTHWLEVYAEAKKQNENFARVLLTDLKAVEITKKVVKLHCTNHLRKLVEANLLFFRKYLFDEYYPYQKLLFAEMA